MTTHPVEAQLYDAIRCTTERFPALDDGWWPAAARDLVRGLLEAFRLGDTPFPDHDTLARILADEAALEEHLRRLARTPDEGISSWYAGEWAEMNWCLRAALPASVSALLLDNGPVPYDPIRCMPAGGWQ